MKAIRRWTKKRQQKENALRVGRWSASGAVFLISVIKDFFNIRFDVDKLFSYAALETIHFTPPMNSSLMAQKRMAEIA